MFDEDFLGDMAILFPAAMAAVMEEDPFGWFADDEEDPCDWLMEEEDWDEEEER